MKFKQLDMTGFKSFSDKTTFLIEDGLTGIVGPNGCGKSNIVESLRWCMGENSAKSMRGSGMEDVIFSGTSNRPSKNISEVTLLLDNQSKEGPTQFKEFEEIQKNKIGLGLGLLIGKTLLEKNFASLEFRNSKTRGGAEVLIKWKNKDLFNI